MKKFWSIIKKDLWVVLLDVIAVNLAYILALAIRFYVNSKLRPVALDKYLPALLSFAPFYTIICIIVFILFRLYGGMWRYAGISDMNRILLANACTFVLQIAGSALFFERMPFTYYIIGGVLQLGFIIFIRFGYRILLVEKSRIRKTRASVSNVLIIGAGELGRRVIRDLNEDAVFKPVCIIGNVEQFRMIDGIPVVGDLDLLGHAIETYKAKNVFIADNKLDTEQRKKIRAVCEEKNVDVQDYTGVLSNQDDAISVNALLELTHCPLLIRTGEEEFEFDNSRDALYELTERYGISSITIENGRLVLDLRKTQQVAFSLEDDQTVAYVGYDAWSKRQ